MIGSRARVRDALVGLLAQRPYCPTVREVADRAGLSVSAAHRHLSGLRRRGEVDWVDGQNRTLHLIQPGGVLEDG